jgi:phosphohistidine phosphatase
MKTLHLIRHADSDWKNTKTDFDRPLSTKGFNDVQVIKQELYKTNFNPSLVICSPAKRTRTTAQLIAKEKITQFEKSIYEAPIDNLKEVINKISNIHNEAALIGHNPSITALANYLIGDFINNMSPCTVIKIDLEIENWNEITHGAGTVVLTISPEGLS